MLVKVEYSTAFIPFSKYVYKINYQQMFALLKIIATFVTSM